MKKRKKVLEKKISKTLKRKSVDLQNLFSGGLSTEPIPRTTVSPRNLSPTIFWSEKKKEKEENEEPVENEGEKVEPLNIPEKKN